MAKSNFVSGKSIQDLLSMDVEKFLDLTPSQTRQVVSRLASAANKRLKRALKSGRESWEIKRVQREGKFSTKGKDITALQQEFARVRQFLENPSTTAKGFKKSAESTAEQLEEIGVEVEETDAARLLALYEEWRDVDKNVKNKEERYAYLMAVNDIIGGGTNNGLRDAAALLNDMKVMIDIGESPEDESALSRYFDIG